MQHSTVEDKSHEALKPSEEPRDSPLGADAYSNDTPCALSPVKHGWKKEWSHTLAKTNK